MSDQRLRILSDAEIKSIYGLPVFTQDDKVVFFALNQEEMAAVETFVSTRSKVYFILQLGYFKATNIFHDFIFDNVRNDAEYIADVYFPKKNLVLKDKIWKKNILLQRNKILELCKYQRWDSKSKRLLSKKIKMLVRIHPVHIDIVREIISFLESKRIVLPTYRTLQDMITKSLTQERSRLDKLLHKYLNNKISSSLQKMLQKGDSLSQLAILKKEPKNFKLHELLKEVEKCRQYKELFEFSKITLPKLKISNKCIKYYADMAEEHTISSLRKIKPVFSELYLLCYIFHRYQKINDRLIVIFIYHVSKFVDDSKEFANKIALAHNLRHNENMVLVSKILKLIADSNFSKNIKLYSEFQHEAFTILPKDQFIPTADYILGNSFDYEKCRWQYYTEQSLRIKRYLRPLIINIEFTSDTLQSPIIEAIDFLKKTFVKGASLNQIKQKNFPKKFIQKSKLRYLLQSEDSEKLNVDRYEFLIYLRLKKFFNTGDIFCNNSTEYKSYSNDLLRKEIWNDKTKNKILKKLDYPNISITGEDRLKQLESTLDPKIMKINKHIANGENKSIIIQGEGENATWTLRPNKAENDINNPFYDNLPPINIIDLLIFVNKQCGFLEAFTHIKPRYAKKNADNKQIIACFIANAFNLGTYKMSEMCEFRYNELFSIEKNFIRLETLRKANDIVSNEATTLKIFDQWNIMEDKLLAGVDGQKFETRLHTLQSRYSSKYFGINKGVSAYSLLFNNVPANAKIIGANEHESHFVFDIIFNNTSNAKPDAITGDMHADNKINFASLDAINKEFMPYYSNRRRKAKIVYCFKNPTEFQGGFIQPIRNIKKDLIINEWDNFQHFFVSLVMQEATQSTLIRKLSSHERNSRTKRALWEYNNIFMSLYLLEYIDNPILRKNTRKALNRNEAYHQLRRSIANIHGRKFRGTTSLENEIWNQSARLVANCIIFYNSCLLSSLLEHQEKQGNEREVEFIKRLSPIAWQNINLTGKYEFTKEEKTINMAHIMEVLQLELKNHIV